VVHPLDDCSILDGAGRHHNLVPHYREAGNPLSINLPHRPPTALTMSGVPGTVPGICNVNEKCLCGLD